MIPYSMKVWLSYAIPKSPYHVMDINFPFAFNSSGGRRRKKELENSKEQKEKKIPK
jgi:hypothetical protein